LILRKIIKIVATICHNLKLKCTKFNFGKSSAQDPTGGAHSAPPDFLAKFKELHTMKYTSILQIIFDIRQMFRSVFFNLFAAAEPYISVKITYGTP